jgi:putative flippase GtrA
MQTGIADKSAEDGRRLPARGPIASRLGVSSAFVKFLLVGAVAYVVNQAGLLLFYDLSALPWLPGKDSEVDFGVFTHPDARLLIASLLAVEASIVFKFFALEHWTFRDRPRRGWLGVRFLQFNASCAASSIITVATVNTLSPIFGISPYISITIGTIFGFLVNWALSAYVIWPHRSPDSDAPQITGL